VSYLQIMVTETSGVYEFQVNPLTPNTNGDLGAPSWMINSAAFTALRNSTSTQTNATSLLSTSQNAAQFVPAYAKRLSTGEVLLVNSYTGLNLDLKTPYNGEVLVLNGSTDNTLNPSQFDGEFNLGKVNLGFNIISVHATLPPVSRVRGIFAPVFADRR
jgi:hypothetical protein